jgi:hypothetical protein
VANAFGSCRSKRAGLLENISRTRQPSCRSRFKNA